MKNGNPCPKCQGSNHARAEKLITFGREPLSFYSINFLGKKAKFEAFVCKKCGYSELYVRSPDNFRVQGGRDGRGS